MPNYPEDFLVGVQLFNQGNWFESHEAWESSWRHAAGQEADFYKGLIQLAAALCHAVNGNVQGTTRLAASGTAYLRRFAPWHRGVDVTKLLADMAHCLQPYRSTPSDQSSRLLLSAVPQIVLQPAPEHWPDPGTDRRQPSTEEPSHAR